MRDTMADKGYLEKLYKGRPMRILMMGPTGAGKSDTGNTILGEKYFLSKLSLHSVTRRAAYSSKKRFGRVVSVVDTPGVCDTTMTDIEFQNCIMESYIMSSPGPHALLIVLNLKSRFTHECKKTIDFIKNHLSKQVFKNAIVAFTHEDCLIEMGLKFEEYLKTATKDLSELLKMCNQRYVPFNNRSEDEEQVRRLFELIDKTVEMNRGHYTNKFFEKFEKEIQSRIDQRIKYLTEQKSAQLRDLKSESEKYLKVEIEVREKAEKEKLHRDLEMSEKKIIKIKIEQKYDHVVLEKTELINNLFALKMDELKLREELLYKLENENLIAKNEVGSIVLKSLKNVGIGIGAFLGGVLAAPFLLVGGVGLAIVAPVVALISKIQFNDDTTESENDIKDFVKKASKLPVNE